MQRQGGHSAFTGVPHVHNDSHMKFKGRSFMAKKLILEIDPDRMRHHVKEKDHSGKLKPATRLNTSNISTLRGITKIETATIIFSKSCVTIIIHGIPHQV